MAYTEMFFRHIMHNYAIKSLAFTKLDNFSLKYRNFSKFLTPMVPKMCHWTHFVAPQAPKVFRNFGIR